MSKLVSIITPCYNGEKYLDKYFQSFLAQTYPNIELIFVNDGSNDNTEKIALEYGAKLEEKGYRFIYIRQNNSGQSAAINQGLRLFSGDYLNWTDADDFLPDNSVERRVAFLEHNPNIGLVIGRAVIVDDTAYKTIGITQETDSSNIGIRGLTEDYLKGEVSCPCCATMVRASMFRDSMPDSLQIEAPREIGQNYQLFLPIMFKYPTRFIPEVVGYYVIHPDSHSHTEKTFEQKWHIQNVATETLHHISTRLKVDEKDVDWFKKKIAEYDCKNRLELLQHCQRKDKLPEIVNRLRELGKYDRVARKIVLKIKYPLIKRLADWAWRRKNL